MNKCECGHTEREHLYFPDKRYSRPCGKCDCKNFKETQNKRKVTK